MPKYDDFGRPIYETAEEYNKAHREGKTSQTYNSTQSIHKQSITRKKSKKGLIVVIGMLSCFISITLVLMFNTVGTREPEEHWVNTDEAIVLNKEALPDGFEIFSYKGELCSLPTDYQQMYYSMGFELLEGYDINEPFPEGYDLLFAHVMDEDGYTIAMIRITNYTGEEITLGEGCVDYFYISNPAVFEEEKEVPDFMFGDGLTLESSYEELEEYFGEPYFYTEWIEEGVQYSRYNWLYYDEDENHMVNIVFCEDAIWEVEIEKSIN